MNSRSIFALAILFGGAFVTLSNGQDGTPAPPADSRVPVAAPPIHEDPAIMIKVFTLDNVTAAGAFNVLQQILPTGRFFADERTNSVIAQGVAPELEKVEALLLQLDRPTAEWPKESPAGETRDRPSLDEFLRGLRGRYSSTEEQALTVAESLAAEKDAAASQRLRERLKIVVTESFGLRQELQKAELELLRERIRGIEAQLQQRENLRDEIIKHRVEQLASSETVSRSPPPASSMFKPRDLSAVGDVSAARAVTPSPTRSPGNAIVWVEAIVPSAENAKVSEAVYGNGVIVSPDGLIVVALGRELSRVTKEARESFRATVTTVVYQNQRKSKAARIVLIDEQSSVALLKMDATDLPYLVCRPEPWAAGQRLSVLSRTGEDSTTSSDDVVARAFEPGEVDLPGTFGINRGFSMDNHGAAIVASGRRLVGFLTYRPDRDLVIAVSTSYVVELLESYRRATSVEESSDPAAPALGAAAKISDPAAPALGAAAKIEVTDDGVLILRGHEDAVKRIVDEIKQVQGNRGARGQEAEPEPRNELPK